MNVDYGCVHPLLVVLDHSFGELIRQHVEAILYAPPTTFPGISPFTVGLIFDDARAAHALFRIFRHWGSGSSEDIGDGLWITINLTGGADYHVRFGPAMDTLLQRATPGRLAEFLDVRMATFHHVKVFDAASPHFAAFRQAWDGHPVTLQAFLAEGPYPRQIAGAQLRQVPLCILEDPAADALDFPVEGLADGEPPARDHSPAAVSGRRQGALHRYFPVTLERLDHYAPFLALTAELQSAGFQAWQVEQAACNLSLPGRFAGHPRRREASGSRSPAEVLCQLEAEPEGLTHALPRLTAVRLRNQIYGDALMLARFVNPACQLGHSAVQSWLAERGYLGSGASRARLPLWSF